MLLKLENPNFQACFDTLKNYLKNKQINKLHPYHSIFTKWLLHLTLIWSVFLFSGYVTSDFLRLPTLPETELVEFPSSNASDSISQHYIGQLTFPKQIALFCFCPKAALIAYNTLQQVRFIIWQQKRCAFPFSFIDLPIKVIPSFSKEATPA